MDPAIKGISQCAAKAAGAFASTYVNEIFVQAIEKMSYKVSKKNLNLC
jgi:hypothetical protein